MTLDNLKEKTIDFTKELLELTPNHYKIATVFHIVFLGWGRFLASEKENIVLNYKKLREINDYSEVFNFLYPIVRNIFLLIFI